LSADDVLHDLLVEVRRMVGDQLAELAVLVLGLL
jgi:hypothetical protein